MAGSALSRLAEPQGEAFLLKLRGRPLVRGRAGMLDAGICAPRMRVMRAREPLQELLKGRV